MAMILNLKIQPVLLSSSWPLWPWSMTSTSPSTSSQQLVWSCSPFFTNSMISQLQVPAVIKMITSCKWPWQYLHRRVRRFWRRERASPLCRLGWSGRPLGSWTQFRFSATWTFDWHVLGALTSLFKEIFNDGWADRGIFPVFQPPALATNFWHVLGAFTEASLFTEIFNDESLDSWHMVHICMIWRVEGCLVFAGYGAIVFMWQISLKRK